MAPVVYWRSGGGGGGGGDGVSGAVTGRAGRIGASADGAQWPPAGAHDPDRLGPGGGEGAAGARSKRAGSVQLEPCAAVSEAKPEHRSIIALAVSEEDLQRRVFGGAGRALGSGCAGTFGGYH